MLVYIYKCFYFVKSYINHLIGGFKMKKESSAGAVLFRKDENGIQYLLLHYQADHWDLPKGNIEKNETELETVRREVKEETGIGDIVLFPDFKERVTYFYKSNKDLISKEAIFYLASTDTKQVTLSFEHIGFAWLSYNPAMKKLTFKTAKDVLEKANNYLKANNA